MGGVATLDDVSLEEAEKLHEEGQMLLEALQEDLDVGDGQSSSSDSDNLLISYVDSAASSMSE